MGQRFWCFLGTMGVVASALGSRQSSSITNQAARAPAASVPGPHKRRAPASAAKPPRQPGVAPNEIHYVMGVPFVCLFAKRFDAQAAEFQLRHSATPKSDFTDTARANLLREYDLAKMNASNGTPDDVLAHYGANRMTITRLRKALDATASTNAQKKGAFSRAT